MKIITTILYIILNLNNLINTQNKASLERVLAKREAVWIVGGLSDSIENQILDEMAKEPRWKEALKDWETLSHEDYLNLISNHGMTLTHSEIHREIAVEPKIEWVERFGKEVTEEFFYRFSKVKGGIYKQILIHIEIK